MTSNQPSPRSGDDTFDLIDDALTTLAERRGLWLGDDLTAMALVASLIEQAERCLPQFVHDARANGHTWHEIAHALGTSPTTHNSASTPKHPSPTTAGPISPNRQPAGETPSAVTSHRH